jgi:hypothetical protein
VVLKNVWEKESIEVGSRGLESIANKQEQGLKYISYVAHQDAILTTRTDMHNYLSQPRNSSLF